MVVTLRFIAREDAIATLPGSRANLGQPAWYVGRKYLPADPKTGKPASYPATEDPYEVTLDLDKQDDASRFNRFVKIAKRGDIWAADADTAKACGVELVKATDAKGEWQRAAPPAPVPPGEQPPATVLVSEPTTPSTPGTRALDVESSAPSLPPESPAPPPFAEPDFSLPTDILESAFDEKVSHKTATKKRS
jgi:hypothetical protein